MTDEELWLKHIEEYPQIKTWSEEKREGARKGFKSGLAEGRKEKCFEQNKDGTIRPCEVMKENEELKRDKTELTNSVTELKTKVTELENQIEKLKTCRNCNKEFTEICETCKRGLYDGEFDKWELAE